jgi:serine/threonine protein phosphatase 1
LRVYAIGDVHGRLDLLDQLLSQIVRDAETGRDLIKYIVFLGDYIDRGPNSRAVIDRLAAPPPPGFGAIHLKGNHEAAMLKFLADAPDGLNWLRYGGLATLASYGVRPPEDDAPPEHVDEARRRLQAAMPAHHKAFLNRLRMSLSIGDYYFVHAGVRPGTPLDRQNDHDMLWIREEFLHSTVNHGKLVVHGHTIVMEPDIRPNRIGIDTGAYATNRLTALVLEGTDQRFLCTV